MMKNFLEIAVLCLALTGCGASAEQQRVNSGTARYDIEMSNGIQTVSRSVSGERLRYHSVVMADGSLYFENMPTDMRYGRTCRMINMTAQNIVYDNIDRICCVSSDITANDMELYLSKGKDYYSDSSCTVKMTELGHIFAAAGSYSGEMKKDFIAEVFKMSENPGNEKKEKRISASIGRVLSESPIHIYKNSGGKCVEDSMTAAGNIYRYEKLSAEEAESLFVCERK